MKTSMHMFACIIMVAASHGGLVRADTNEDPVDLLKKVDAAAKAVDAVAYETEYQGLGDSAAQIPKIKAKIVSQGTGDRPKRFRADLQITMPGSEEVKHLTVGSDGNEYYVIDHAARKAYVDIDPSVLGGAGRAAAMASVAEFGHAQPFSDEINAKKQEMRGICEVGGEEGYEINVVYANDMQEAVWCFSKKTFLPRKRLDTIKLRAGGTRSQQRVITSLKLLDSVADDTFKARIPEGFETVDDFYPN